MKINDPQAPSSFSGRFQELLGRVRIPRATYRLQFKRDFTFRQAQDLVPYFDELGISDLYASPLFRPCSEEGHGYDICDHRQFNPAIGTQEEFGALSAALQARSMGLILDVVPNHMGISRNNLWWMDVLENGPSSTFARYFDIDLNPTKPELQNKVLLPILEDQYGKVLESGKFRLTLEDGAFYVYYYEHKLPVAPRTYSKILGYMIDALAKTLGKDNENLQELQSILTALSYLPLQTEMTPEKLAERKREKEVIKRRIAALYQNSSEVKAAIDAAVQAFNGAVGDPRSFDLLDDLLNAQAYRPAFWRVAADEINYRRFFDINQLAAIRMELPEVFQEAHQFIFHLLQEGKISGLRVDHPDGLWNPTHYFLHLQEQGILLKATDPLVLNGEAPAGPQPGSGKEFLNAWMAHQTGRQDPAPWPLYVLAEKILGEGEPLPADWAVYGTTGYEFLNALNGLFVDRSNSKVFDRIYSHFIGHQIHFGNLVNSTKKIIMLVSMASEIQAICHQLERLSEKNRWYRDFTLNSLTFILREVIACLPVYRTYITGPESVPARDQAYIEAAVQEAKRRNPRTAEAIFDFIRDTLLLRNIQNFPEEDRGKLIDFVLKFQQITGPVMAKGLEDTAFYVYNRLVSLNEVGGHPDRFGISVADFHQQNIERQQKWPHSLLATSTHDTKRSEDVRSRINVLSEIPGEWRAALNRWSRLNSAKKILVDGQPAPDRNDEYLLYQTLVGSWPAAGTNGSSPLSAEELANFRERIASYMEKATLEAKVHTSWINRNKEYDAAVQNFVGRVVDNRGKNRFLSDLQAFQHRVAYFGRVNTLAQVLLKLTSPGVPDMYQGTEIWDFSLVDPDNRRPVDYQQRRRLLNDLKDQVDRAGQDLIPLIQQLLDASQDGRIKLYLILRTLHFRRAHQELMARGAYLPLEAVGEKKGHLCAFARILANEEILVATPRLIVGLTGGVEQPPLGERVWKDTWLTLPPEWGGKTYRHLFTGERVAVGKRDDRMGLSAAEIFNNFPVALLERIVP
ncbi:MAG: malto-oligosyltrehalose synthase [Proteobacteria bacterium]|nr:malto-oligosyltrehalose synthase [Pseudomonadota bacterium]